MDSSRGPKQLSFTHHAHAKMRFYGFSEQRVKRVLHAPARIEEGIAPETIAMMQVAGTQKHSYEIWVMISEKDNKRNIVSAWRYPGRTKPGEPLPAAVIRELRNSL